MFEKTLKLTEHLRRTSACLQSMGGNIAAAVKIIAKMKRKPEEKAPRRERYRRKKVRLDESGRYGFVSMLGLSFSELERQCCERGPD